MIGARQAGLLLHVTSLPGSFGIGDLGPGVDAWLDWLESSAATIWQVLPLGPTSFGDSPYQCLSSAAGNPLMISPRVLREQGLLGDGDLAALEVAPGPIEFGAVIEKKREMLDRAYDRMGTAHRDAFRQFRADQASWLDDFCLFMALKGRHGGLAWFEWDDDMRLRHEGALRSARDTLRAEINRHAFDQWQFFSQWTTVRERAADRGIEIFGDLPLYVAGDSADVWARPDLFALDDDRRPLSVAGVPPDYFSPTGQLWGNPIYRWGRHAAEGFQWWIDRFRRTLELMDVVRIDHFRGFADYWEVPAGSPTAETGRWVEGPGVSVFEALDSALGPMPIVAEDLGDLSPAVLALRDELGYPGMAIMQFAWDGDPDNPFLPEHIREDSVAYTGTHDNDTTVGWFSTIRARERWRVRRRLRTFGREISWNLIEAVWHSPARVAIAPMQDVLNLPTTARMNVPGTPLGNWRWRLEGSLDARLAERVAALTMESDRTGG